MSHFPSDDFSRTWIYNELVDAAAKNAVSGGAEGAVGSEAENQLVRLAATTKQQFRWRTRGRWKLLWARGKAGNRTRGSITFRSPQEVKFDILQQGQQERN
ncbi:uncharacterized protein N7503_006583 [Penicillium pulvis]|uniref:uncharacterized protein n=1 Tax=Penicillium pulvis TaxID=1562058 RepID=UPI002548DD64|nr:uncharacterized protein N7503_006583 [Penicillium pulvis]KAJ5797287.1 hypothetical protein N7503_006583 [Penicillium pulvis]